MARKQSSRKFQLTINNPVDHGYIHEQIRSILSEFSGLQYWCRCDEIGEQGTPHTHIYMVSSNGIMFDTMHRKFYGVHIEKANGGNQQNRDYVRKAGKWQDDAKHETSLPDTFEEWGELPPDRTHSETQADRIVQMIRDGKSNVEILDECSTAYSKIAHIEQTRQAFLAERFKNEFRKLNVTYLWGDTAAEILCDNLCDILVVRNGCRLAVAATDMERKPNIIDKGTEIIPPLLGRQMVSHTARRRFLFLLVFLACFLFPRIRCPFSRFLCFCRG